MPKFTGGTALNRCVKCGKEVQLFVPKYQIKMWESVKTAVCSVCLPGSEWRRTNEGNS